jgi:hypothetical protein
MYPTKPTGDNVVSENYIFALNNTLKSPMSSDELLEGYNNKGESETELTSIPDASKFNSFLYQMHNTLVWVIGYITELYSAKFDKTGGALSGPLNMGSNKVTSLSAGTVSTDAINKAQLDAVSTVVDGLNPDIVVLGEIVSGFSLLADKVHTGSILTSCGLSLPTLGSANKFVNCMLTFTIISGQTLTIPASVKWNYGVTPVFSSASGVKNRIMFDTVDGGVTWTGYYSQIGA